MPKYRTLTNEELIPLEKEFIEFLIINGIEAEDWENLKSKDLDKVNLIIDHFSDVVFEKILRKTQYLEFHSQHKVVAYHCLSSSLISVALTIDQKEGDLTNPDFIRKAMTQPPGTAKLVTAERKYTKQREIELFALLENGCTMGDGELFKTLCLAL